ncbi:MAG: hypothetical protein ACE5NP_10530 [Anaerolineae bacterium]
MGDGGLTILGVIAGSILVYGSLIAWVMWPRKSEQGKKPAP